jgi:hypothetical protein
LSIVGEVYVLVVAGMRRVEPSSCSNRADRSEASDMSYVYEYWQHRVTTEVWAVKLSDGEPIGATRIGRADVHADLLPHLTYRADDLADLQKREADFKRIDGRRVA